MTERQLPGTQPNWRDYLAEFFSGDADADEVAPWYAWPEPLAPGSRVAVIGAGIAGATAARALDHAGFAVTVYETDDVAAGASATPAAVLQPRPLSAADAAARFHAAAYRAAVELYDGLEAAGHPVWCQRGLLVLGRDADDAERFRKLGAGEPVGPEQAGRRCGLGVGLEGTWFADAGALDGVAVCRALLDGIEVCRGRAVSASEALRQADAVVVAAGYASMALSGFGALGLNGNRGQLTGLAPNASLADQAAPVTYGGYLVKGREGHWAGSSFRRIANPDEEQWREPDADDDAANLALLSARLPAFASTAQAGEAAWVGLRATTADRFPVLGPVPDVAAFEADYARLRHGPIAGPLIGLGGVPFAPARFRPGLFVFSGLGARGFLTAPLCAEILAAGLKIRALAQPKSALHAMHPARYLINRIKRTRS